jgi:hypothetical protein
VRQEDVDPNRHLRGAYSLASCEASITGSPPDSLLAARFWNYLREDITFSLFEGCPLKMDVTESAAPSLADDGHDKQLHSVSLILGQIINKAFRSQISAVDWQKLVDMVHTWLGELPTHVQPFSRGRSVTLSTVGELPSFWFLQDFHGKCSPPLLVKPPATVTSWSVIANTKFSTASARQYLLVSLSILAVSAQPGQLSMLPAVNANTAITGHAADKDDLLDAYALEICGIAFTTNIPSVVVNSFGPIAYCK